MELMTIHRLLHGSIAALLNGNRKKQSNNRTIEQFKAAFTLIELLVVISIIAILLAVATVSYTNAQQKGRDNKRKADLKAVQQALEIYFNQNGKYPDTDASSGNGIIKCNTGTSPNNDSTSKNWGSIFSCDPDGPGSLATITYMNPLPKDPVNTGNSNYYYNKTSNSTYVLYAVIENSKDQENKNDGNPQTTPVCDTISGHTWPNTNLNYCVINP